VDPDGRVCTGERKKDVVFPKMPVIGEFDVKAVLKAAFMLN
jgi:hypothetical protein